MNKRRVMDRAIMISALIVAITSISTNLRADSGTCGGQMITLPFADVAGSTFFCQIAEAYFSGLTNGTSATTYSPSQNVTREQMAAFITRTLDQETRRSSRRAALDQWWQGSFPASGTTDVGNLPGFVKSDGEDLWVTSGFSNTVTRVRASDGRVLGTWTAADDAAGVLVTRGRIYITGSGSPGSLYRIDPRQPPGDVTVVSHSLGGGAVSIATDDTFIWTTNYESVSRINPVSGAVSTFTSGFNRPAGVIFDGSSIWMTDAGSGALKKLNTDGTIALSIPIGTFPQNPIFDGANLWVVDTDFDGAVIVVRVKDAQGNPLSQPVVLATLTGNGLLGPHSAAFDGERILVTNSVAGIEQDSSVSMWRAADLAPLGSFSAPSHSSPLGVCSDGINFWVVLAGADKVARF